MKKSEHPWSRLYQLQVYKLRSVMVVSASVVKVFYTYVCASIICHLSLDHQLPDWQETECEDGRSLLRQPVLFDRCVLWPPLFSLNILHFSGHLQTTEQLSNMQRGAYGQETDQLLLRCSLNDVELIPIKTVEMTLDAVCIPHHHTPS